MGVYRQVQKHQRMGGPNVETGEVDTNWMSYLAETLVKARGEKSPQSPSPPAPQKKTQHGSSKKPKRLPGSIPVPCRNKKYSDGNCKWTKNCWFQHSNVKSEPLGTSRKPNCRNPVGKCPFKDRCRYQHRNPRNVKRAERRKKKKAAVARDAAAAKEAAAGGKAAAEKVDPPVATSPGPATPQSTPCVAILATPKPCVGPASGLASPAGSIDAVSPPSGPPKKKRARFPSPLQVLGFWPRNTLSPVMS